MKYEFPSKEWDLISPQARDLISKMLVARPDRLSAKGVIEHPWMTMKMDEVKHRPLNVHGLKVFLQGEKLRKFTLSILASQSSERDLKNLYEIFLKIDTDGDGKITYSELEEVLKSTGQTKELTELQEIMIKTGVDRKSPFHYNGTRPHLHFHLIHSLHKTDFLASMIETKDMRQEQLERTFKLFDKKGIGKISKEEIKLVLSKIEAYKNMPESFYSEVLKEVDKNQDGFVNLFIYFQ